MLFLFASGLQSLSPSLSAAIELCILWHRHAAACRGRCLKLKAGMRFDLGHRFSTGRSSARMGMPSYQWPNQLYKARRSIQILSYIGTLLLDVERYANHFSMQQKKRSRAGYKEPEYLIQTTHSGQLVSCQHAFLDFDTTTVPKPRSGQLHESKPSWTKQLQEQRTKTIPNYSLRI